MKCSNCNTMMIEGEPVTIFSSVPIGIKIEGSYLGSLCCFVCPNCAYVTFGLSQKAMGKLTDKIKK